MNTVYRTFTKSALKKRNVISEETIKFSSTKVQCSSSIRACFSRYYMCCLFFVCVSLFLATMILSLSLSLSLSLTRANIILRIDTVLYSILRRSQFPLLVHHLIHLVRSHLLLQSVQ